MNYTKQDMIRLLRRMGEARKATGWIKKRNEELYAVLQMITMPAGEQRESGKEGVFSAKQILEQREKIEKEIRQNKNMIEERLQEYAVFTRLMTEVLSEDEKEVLWNRHAERMTWERVARMTRLSRSSCFRAEATGIETLRRAWEKQQNAMEQKYETKEGMMGDEMKQAGTL